jgi:hypothetical protein
MEPRRHARAFVLGLLADLPRKNCWTIAKHAGMPPRMACSTYWTITLAITGQPDGDPADGPQGAVA